MNRLFLNYLKYIILAIIIYFPIFGYLNTLPVRIWDESRLAINAYEMNIDGDWIVTHYEGKPDMWNTKPPLMIWAQVIFMKLIGVNELSVRLPSAIATFLTCIALLVFSLKYLKNYWFGYISVIVLITSHGYINTHASRTGDYDALLTLFTTLYCLFFFLFIESQNIKYLYYFFISLILSVLTKSVNGLLFLPALIIFTLIQKKVFFLLKNKHLYINIVIFLFIVLGYYMLREFQNPGYLKAVQENELGGRYLEVTENHTANFWFYYNNFINFQLTPWYLMVPCGLIVGLFHKDKKIFKLTLYAILLILTFFIVISTSKTKLEWYDVPLYPIIAIVVSVFIYFIFNLLNEIDFINRNHYIKVLPLIFLFIICINPYVKIINKTYLPKEYDWDKNFYRISYILKKAVKSEYCLDNFYLLNDGNKAHLLFYVNILKEKMQNVDFKQWENLSCNDHVIAYQENVIEYIEKNYTYELLVQSDNVKFYKIINRVKY